jgi:enamine deaminase RidA (YjgF/YER057c/UK114 family)
MPFETIPTGIAPSTSPVSDANRAGRHVWLVAIAEDPVTGEIVPGGIEAQTRRTLMNLEIAVRAAGGALSDVVAVHVFLIDRGDAEGMNAVYREFFHAPFPVRATVVVKELLANGLRVEMTATAVLGSPD